MTQADFGFDDGGPDLERLREFDADFTPTPVVRQVLEHLRDAFHLNPRTMLDPCAGAGVFGMVAREVWPGCKRFGIEVRVEELQELLRHYDDHALEPCEKLLADPTAPWLMDWHGGGGFDLIITNPAFSLWPNIVPKMLQLLNSGGYLVLLGLCDVLLRGEAGLDLAQSRPPWWELAIPGAIGFRGPGINPKNGKPWGTDQRSYSWEVWHADSQLEGPGGPAWYREPLPRLPAADRRWVVKPGTENTGC